MNIKENSSYRAETVANSDELFRRTRIRWAMVFYDLLIYLACYIAVFLLRPSISNALPKSTLLLYLGFGLVCFFGFRFAFLCYKYIFRYGKMPAFSRELLASSLGGTVFISVSLYWIKVLKIATVPVVSIVSFAAVYIVFCTLSRFVYFYLYRFALKDNFVSRIVKKLLIAFTFVDFESKKPGATLSSASEERKNVTAPINDLQNIAENFAICGTITVIKQINKGYINRTYRVETISEAGHVHKYILQRINTNVFPDVDALMSNFQITTSVLFDQLEMPGVHSRGSVQTLRPTLDGKLYFRDDSGAWRLMTYFDNVYSMDIPDSPEVFYYAGVSFGRFLKEMSSVDVGRIKEVIPNFHNTKSRYFDLEEAISRDRKKRVKDVLKEIEFIRCRSEKFGMISDALQSGKIPTRICHNDCNLNNILFDEKTHLPVAIIDLDTVMPSSPLYDFGDSMRIGTNTAKDDEKDLSKVSCDLSLYEQYARGYLESCGDVLTREEFELLPYASLIITAEDGIRFLMDHINGDTYYHIYYPGQNLDRSLTQFKLLEDMEKKLPEIKKILQKIYDEKGLKARVI